MILDICCKPPSNFMKVIEKILILMSLRSLKVLWTRWIYEHIKCWKFLIDFQKKWIFFHIFIILKNKYFKFWINKTLDTCCVTTVFENWLVWTVWESALWNLGENNSRSIAHKKTSWISKNIQKPTPNNFLKTWEPSNTSLMIRPCPT
jgi:hypothetical protein